jgi:hypothetical protein
VHYEPQPQSLSTCSCGHVALLHEDTEHPLLSENGEGACRRCPCQRYDGLPPRLPRWIFLAWGGEAYTVESVLRNASPEDEVPAGKPESFYRDLLASQVGGRIEVTLPFGRADVMTDTTVYEVEPAARWTDGIAKALQYAAQVPQRGAIALYGDGPPLAKVRAKLASLPAPGLELWWLKEGRFARQDP